MKLCKMVHCFTVDGKIAIHSLSKLRLACDGVTAYQEITRYQHILKSRSLKLSPQYGIMISQ